MRAAQLARALKNAEIQEFSTLFRKAGIVGIEKSNARISGMNLAQKIYARFPHPHAAI